MQVLLTFVGFHDPYFPSRIDGEELKGPILYLLGIRAFDRMYLLSAANIMELARRTAAAIRSAFGAISSECEGARFAISTASGTPQMHACWLLLASSGEIPATILQTRPPQYVTTDKPAVEEVGLGAIADPAAALRVVKSLAAQARETTTSLDEIALAELNIIGRHPSFRAALSRASQFARSPFPVLIQGETGKGKERVARYIHRLSGLPTGSLEVVNCAALPRELAASLLFGHRKGAFERADGGVAGPGGLAAVRRRPHGKRRAPRAP